MKNIELKKAIASILESAHPLKKDQSGMYIAEWINEYGFKCTYRFSEDMREALLKRAGQLQRAPSQKYTYKSWEVLQKGMAFLEKNKNVIGALYDIDYQMKEHGYDVQQACSIVFKDKKKLPPGFYKCYLGYGYPRYTHFCCVADNKKYEIDLLIRLLPTLPKAWLDEIDIL